MMGGVDSGGEVGDSGTFGGAWDQVDLMRRALELRDEGRLDEVVRFVGPGIPGFEDESVLLAASALGDLGRPGEALATLRPAAARGYPPARREEVRLLACVLDRTAEGATAGRRAAEAGVRGAASLLAHVLNHHLGDPLGAEPWAEQAIVEGDARGHWELARVCVARGERRRASLQHDLAVGRGYEPSAGARADLLAELGRLDEAETVYRQLVAEGDPEAANDLGLLLHDRAGRLDEAEALFRSAMAAGHVHAPMNLGRLLADRGGADDEAERLLRGAVAEGHDHADNNLANLLARTGRTDEAVGHYRRAIEHGEPLALMSYAVLLDRQGDTAEAERLLRTAVAQGCAAAARNLAIILNRAGDRPAEVEALYRQALAGGDRQAHFGLGHFLAAVDGREAEAVIHLEAAIDAGRDDVRVNLANLLARRGELAEAEQHYRRAVDDGIAVARNAYASFLRTHHRYDDVVELLTPVLDQPEPPLRVVLELGTALSRRGDLDAALPLLERVAAERPDSSFTLYELGCALVNAGRLDEGEARLVRATELGNTGARAWLAERGVVVTGDDDGDAGAAAET
jgi:tetratricopeptide (TPR) repeat protein